VGIEVEIMNPNFVKFGPCWDQSGVRGFFGEGYWFHHFWSVFGLDLRGSTFVAKTTTLHARDGNMPLTREHAPKQWFPDCVIVKPRAGVVLNAVGLSGPGALTLFNTGTWQLRKRPFMLSFMAVGDTVQARLNEAEGFARIANDLLKSDRSMVGLQVNLSCPNVGAAPRSDQDFVNEARGILSRLSCLMIPLFPKLSVTTSPEAARMISDIYEVAGLVVSNTIPWGKLPGEIDWHGLFGPRKFLAKLESPLAKYGGGALSGAPLLPLVAEWLQEAKNCGVTKPIAAGGGVLHPRDVDVLVNAGARAICVGSAAILRPWRVGSIVRRAHELLGRKA
jgi:dihydroorotate dehydrogenase